MIQPKTTDNKSNKCCTDDSLVYSYGDEVEWEVYHCIQCYESYVVDIEIVRDFKNMERIK